MTKQIAALGMLATLVGCYNTLNVKNGRLVCGTNDTCPDGFTCVKDGATGQPGHCWKHGTGPDASVSVPRTDAAPGPTCTDAAPPLGCEVILPGTGSTCDPVCQSGCPCGHRCVVNEVTYRGFECEASVLDRSSLVGVQNDCGGQRWASCEPGSMCIGDDLCPWLCYRTCRQDADCGASSRCSANSPLDIDHNAVPGVYLCTPPIETCNPTGAAACATPRANFSCVFLAGQTGVASDSTICDCRSLHTKGLGEQCSFLPDDCQPGLVCVDRKCQQLCDRQGPAPACASGTCQPVYGSTRYGYCR